MVEKHEGLKIALIYIYIYICSQSSTYKPGDISSEIH